MDPQAFTAAEMAVVEMVLVAADARREFHAYLSTHGLNATDAASALMTEGAELILRATRDELSLAERRSAAVGALDRFITALAEQRAAELAAPLAFPVLPGAPKRMAIVREGRVIGLIRARHGLVQLMLGGVVETVRTFEIAQERARVLASGETKTGA